MYGIISICLFFAVFTGMLVWAVCLKKTVSELDARTAAGRRCRSPNRNLTNPNPENHHE